MKTLGRAGRAALIFQVGFGCGFLVGGILAVANYSKDQRMKAGRHQEVTWIAREAPESHSASEDFTDPSGLDSSGGSRATRTH